MDLSKSILAIIAVFVGVLVTATILVPVVGGFTDDEVTIENTGARYSLYELGDTHTITFTADSMITDGVAQPLPDTSDYGSATVVYGTGIFRYHSDGNIRFWGVLSGGDINRSLGLAVNVTITIDETGTARAINSDSSVVPREFSGTLMYANPSGDYALSKTPYVVDDSPIYGCGNTVISDVTYTLSWAGSVEDGITVSWVYPPEQETGEIVVNTSEVRSNLLKIDSIVIPIEGTDGEATYTYFFAPYEVSYDNPNKLDNSTYTALLLVLPVLMFIVCALVAVRAISGRAD